MNSVKRLLLRQAWPKGDLDLLLRTALLPPPRARRHWEAWKARRNIDDVSWEEHKVLAPLAGRLREVAPDCPLRPRLEGLAKSHWTQSQLMLRESAAALDTLQAAGLPVMLLKGAALEAAGHRRRGPRITSDLDVLVRREDFPRAIGLLYGEEWSSRDSREYAMLSWRFHSGINLRRGRHGDVDIHHQPVHEPLLPADALEAFWRRAVPATFQGRRVLVPTPADLLVLAAAHGVRPSAERHRSAAWALDVASLIAGGTVKPAEVVERAASLGALPATLAALSYLHTLTDDPATADIIAALQSAGSDPGGWLRLYGPSHGKPLRWIAGLFSGAPAETFEVERRVVPRLRPALIASRISGVERPGSGDSGLRHEIELPEEARHARALVLDLSFERVRVVRRYRFDISVDGVPVARLSSRRRIGREGGLARISVTVPLPAGGRRLAVEALREGELPPNADAARFLATRAAAFRIESLGWR